MLFAHFTNGGTAQLEMDTLTAKHVDFDRLNQHRQGHFGALAEQRHHDGLSEPLHTHQVMHVARRTDRGR